MQRVIQGDVFEVLPTLKPGSVDCCVTSTPYWKLRSYLAKDHPLKHLELGSEATPAEFIANMVRVFGLVRTAMADHAVCWVNIGDSYSSQGGSGKQGGSGQRADRRFTLEREGGTTPPEGIEAGNLCLMPQRLAIALQDDGWFVRSIVVWAKPAPMPASLSGWQWQRCRVKTKAQGKSGLKLDTAGIGNSPPWPGNGIQRDAAQWSDCPGCKKCEATGGYRLRKGSWRPTSSYEPVLMLAKSANYFADGEPVKTPPKDATVSRDQYTRVLDDPDEQFAVKHDHETICDGANLRDVWTIAAEPLREKHYASYPRQLVANCLKSSVSAKGYCPECGAPWVRMVEPSAKTEAQREAARNGKDWTARSFDNTEKIGDNKHGNDQKNVTASLITLEWRASCLHHNLEPRPGLVLDPFGGSGRTAITAQQLGFDSVSVELNPDYAEMARGLIYNDNPIMNIFNAMENL